MLPFDVPLVVQRTFLHFRFQLPSRPRSESAPAALHAADAVLHAADAALHAADAAPPEHRSDEEAYSDDEAALRDGRAQALRETWRLWVKRLLSDAAAGRRRNVAKKTLRHRLTLSSGGFAQTAAGLQYSPEEIFRLSRFGFLRVDEETGSVEIWCDDERTEAPQMKVLLAEAEAVRDLSQDYFFVHAPDFCCVVRYVGRQKVKELKRQLGVLGDTPRQMHLFVLGEEEPLGDDAARLAKTSVRPGCLMRIADASGD